MTSVHHRVSPGGGIATGAVTAGVLLLGDCHPPVTLSLLGGHFGGGGENHRWRFEFDPPPNKSSSTTLDERPRTTFEEGCTLLECAQTTFKKGL